MIKITYFFVKTIFNVHRRRYSGIVKSSNVIYMEFYAVFKLFFCKFCNYKFLANIIKFL